MCELDLSVNEFYSLTLSQFEVLSDGYKRKCENEKFIRIDSWRQTRLISFMVAKGAGMIEKHIDVYKFYPLPYDPTEQEIESAKKEEQEKDGKWMKQVIDKFRKLKRS